MTITEASHPGTSKESESKEMGEESDKRPEDEQESDVDHKEMIRSYASDAYLSRWLPNTEDEPVANDRSTSSHFEGTKPGEEERERHCTTPVPPGDNVSYMKSPCENQQHQETEVNRDTKVCHENGRKAYFEAIKCSPMKLQQPINMYKRSKIDESLGIPRPTQNQVEEKLPRSKNHVSPCVVEMTNDPVGQLGSLCFRTRNVDGRRNEVLYSSRHMIGGRMHKVHRNFVNTVSGGKKKSELLVRCESVMIYPKALVTPRCEKPSSKPLKSKEAWRENYFGATSLALGNEEEYTRLPDLEAKEGAMLLDKYDRKLSPVPLQHQEGKHIGDDQNSKNSTSTKIIIPFGETELKCNTSGKERSEKLAMQKVEECQGLEPKPYQATRAFNKRDLDKTSSKKRADFYSSHNARQPNSSEKLTRTVPGMVIGITRLEIPRKTRLITRSLSTATPSSPLSKFKISTADANGLFLGPLNVPQRKSGSRFSCNQRRKPDFSGKTKDHCPIMTSEDQEGCKYFFGTERNLSLKIGGTGLLKEQRSVRLAFGGEKQVENVNRKRVQFNTLVPRSR